MQRPKRQRVSGTVKENLRPECKVLECEVPYWNVAEARFQTWSSIIPIS